jgi:O-antigen/teichoic acid export membrane protein
MLAGLLDSGLSSLATFVIGVYAAQSLSPALLGGYALTFAALSLAAILPDATVFTPLEVLVVQHPRSERLGLLRHTIRTGFLAALLPGLGVTLWTFVAPSELPRDAVNAFTITAVVCAVLSPIQDHVRRMLHSGGESWLAASVSAVQLLVAIAGIGFFASTDLPAWWAPFGVLGAANLVSLAVGLLRVRFRRDVVAATPIWHPFDLHRSSGWMLLVGLIPAGATFLVSALVAAFASPTALGYAETARVVAQPLMVLTLGLSATFSPKLVEAAQSRDGVEAKRVRREYHRLLFAASILYVAVVSTAWAGNPMSWIVPKAYVVPGLVAVMLLSVFAQSLAMTGRFEMMGARREKALMFVEAGGNAMRAGFGCLAAVLGAFAIPFGVLALSAVRVMGQSSVLRTHYAGAAGSGAVRRRRPSSRTASEQVPWTDSPTVATGAWEAIAGERPPLRIGVLVDEGPQPGWVSDTLDALRALPFCRVALVVWIQDVDDRARRRRGFVERVLVAGRHALYTLYSAIDRRAFSVGPDPFASVHIAKSVGDIPEQRIRVERLSSGDRYDDEDVAAIERAQLDVVLNLGSHPLGARLLGVATHGVWWCAQSSTGERSMLPGVWEVMERSPTTTLEVRVHDRRTPTGRVIDRSYLRTQRFSAARNRARLYRKSITLLTLRLRELYEVGRPGEETAEGSSSATTPRAPVGRGTPGNIDTLTAVVGIGTFALRRVLQRGHWPGGWFIAYRRHDDIAGDDVRGLAPETFSTLRPPPGHFWADPFPAYVNGRHFIFFEDYVFATGKGRIAVTEVSADGRCSPAVPVLEREYHLSYPFVFEWAGAHYMVPESVAAGRIEVYRATDFPYRWELHGVALDGIRAVDPTIVEWEGRWWMFANVAQEPVADLLDLNEQLHLFHSTSPLGPWTPHRRNPVKWDARGSRPAGRLFQVDGELHRPAQDCTERYGGSIKIMRVLRLDLDEYVETEVATIEPEWRPDLIGTHTINVVPGLAVIDGRLSYAAATRRASVG